MTAVWLIRNTSSCIESLRSDPEFAKLWAESTSADADDADPTPPKRQRQASKSLQDYVLNESVGQREVNIEQECKRLFFYIIDSLRNVCAFSANVIASTSQLWIHLTLEVRNFWMREK